MRNQFLVAAFFLCLLVLPVARADAQVPPAEDHVFELGVIGRAWTMTGAT